MPACQHASMPISEPRPMAPKLQGVLRLRGANLFGSGVASIASETGALRSARTLLPQALFATPGTFCYPRHFSHASMPACQHASMPAACVAAGVLTRRGRTPYKRSLPRPGGARPGVAEPSGENCNISMPACQHASMPACQHASSMPACQHADFSDFARRL